MIVELIANLGRVARDIDVEFGEFGLVIGEMLERTVIAFDQRRAFDVDEIAKHEAPLDEVDHWLLSLAKLMPSNNAISPKGKSPMTKKPPKTSLGASDT